MPAVHEDLIFRAIAHPTRRGILAQLSRSSCSVKQLNAAFDVSQPAISQHLAELLEANLVTRERVGSEQHYHLAAAPIRVIDRWCAQYRRLFDPAGHAWQLTPAKPAKGARSHGR